MLGRIVEIAEDNRYLSLSRGFMVVQSAEANRPTIGQVPIDDIAAVIANAHGLSYSNNLLVALAKQATPLVLCAANHNPVGMLISIDGNFQQAKRFDAQIAASLPLKKRIWAEIVKAKLQQQAAALNAIGKASTPVSALISKVRSGDPENIEAQAARRYWRLLFGEQFRRDQQADGLNALLNYGYTVLRANTARVVLAAGLHPTLGLHHSNQSNAMRLVDDLMEPFRPMIDLKVWQLHQQQQTTITPETKRHLVRTLFTDMHTPAGVSPVASCVQQLATSLALILIGEKNKLELPLPTLPIDVAASLPQDF
jgi:CRISP-associated protein Cas1